MNWKKTLAVVPLSLSILVPTAVAGSGVANAAEQPTVKTPAAKLRSNLSNLFANHYLYQTFTTVQAYRKAKDGEPKGESVDEAKAHLKANADKIVAAVEKVYGEKAANKFEEIFDSQYDDASGYGKAWAKGNEEKLQEIKHHLLEVFPQNLGTLLSKATGGNLPKETAISVLKAHEKGIMEFAKAYVNGDYQKAYEIFNKGYKRMFTLGKALSSAIVKQKPEMFNHTWAVTPASNLRATFSRLLGLHFFYQTATTTEGYLNAKTDGKWGKDFEVVKEMQEANAQKMADAIAKLYNEKAADKFLSIFNSQYEDSAGYGKAVANGNMDKAKEIKDHLVNTFAVNLGTFLSKATGGNLPKDKAISVLQKHEKSTLWVFNNYRKGEYATAYDKFTAGHNLMFTIGTAVSGAIVQQMPDKFQKEMPGMPKTDLGGTAGDEGETLALILGAMAVLTAGGAFMYRRKTADDVK